MLVRKANAGGWQESVAAWLCRVAYRIATKARTSAARRKAHEQRAQDMPRPTPDRAAQASWQDLKPVLDEELDRLPEKYRLPLVLCYLQNKTNDEAATQLGWTRGTIAGRRELRQGPPSQPTGTPGVPSAVALASVIAQNAAVAAVPTPLVLTTAKAAVLAAVGKVAAAGVVSLRRLPWPTRASRQWRLAKVKMAASVFAVSLVIGGAGVTAYQ